MSFDLVYERFNVKRVVAENTAETLVEGSFTLPDRSPEIGRGLQARAWPQTVTAEVRDGRVIFEGTLGCELLYAHFEERLLPAEADETDAEYDEYDDGEEDAQDRIVIEERLHVVQRDRAIPFAYALELPGVEEGSPVETDLHVVTCHYEVGSDRASVDVDVVLSVSARLTEAAEHRLATDVRGREGIEVKTRKLGLLCHLGEGKGRLEAQGHLRLSGRAVPEKILSVKAVPQVIEASAEDGVVSLKGTVSYEALYVGVEGAGPQWSEWPHALTFDAQVDVPGAERSGTVKVSAAPEATQIRLVEDEGGRLLEVATPIDLQVSVERAKEAPVVVGIESDSKEIALRHRSLQLVERVGEGTQTEEPTAILELPSGAPAIDRVLCGEARAVVDDVHVLGDKVAVEMHVDVDLMYVGRAAGDGTVQTASWPRAVTLDLEIPVRGAEPGLDRSVKAEVKAVRFDLLNRQSVEVAITVTATATLSREVSVELVDQAVAVPPAEADPPTYTYVVVRPGDTVWKLAAYYRSQPEKILAANKWVESEESQLESGRKLCVPRSGGR